MKVKFIGSSVEQVNWGSNDNPDGILEVGKTYEVWNIEVHSWHTKIILTKFPHLKFNSVCFEEIG